jgi:hypothetical protein
MQSKGIVFILVQIEEAHSTAWPIGLDHTPQPQVNLEERFERAKSFVDTDKPSAEVFPVFVDRWDNSFANRFRCWPDKFYCINKDHRVVAHSEYGDAVLVKDCATWIEELLLETDA